MNFKTFVFMILTFRRVDPIPKNIGLMLSITFWISIVWIIFNFAILIMRLIKIIDKFTRDITSNINIINFIDTYIIICYKNTIYIVYNNIPF